MYFGALSTAAHANLLFLFMHSISSYGYAIIYLSSSPIFQIAITKKKKKKSSDSLSILGRYLGSYL